MNTIHEFQKEKAITQRIHTVAEMTEKHTSEW